METKDKLIGIAMILAGVACIVLGAAFLGRTNSNSPVNNNVDIYGNNGQQNIVYSEQ